MRRTVVRYKAKPEMVHENERLIANVFKELHAKSPGDIRYMVLKLADGSFIHFATAAAESAGTPLQRLEAFRTFQSGAKERCLEPPLASEATVVGNYRMLFDE
jgi:hypothetical protein